MLLPLLLAALFAAVVRGADFSGGQAVWQPAHNDGAQGHFLDAFFLFCADRDVPFSALRLGPGAGAVEHYT